jgi:protein disulfide-isomerase
MKKMIILAVTLLLAHIAIAGEWLTDLPKAQEQAKKDSKLVLLDFTGSDWCGWCIKFKKEVLDTDEFKQYADKNLVLVEIDFPNKKAQSDELKKANKALKEKYGVSGYPTYVILSSEGKEVGRQVGYAAGGPKAFIEKLDGFKKK